MNKYKFAIGQTVKVTMDNRWIGEYEVLGTIVSFGNVFYNGVPTYNVKISDKEILNEVLEKRIVL